MIYKGIMGEQEVSRLWDGFGEIYRFASRGEMLIPVDTKEKLAELDIEAEIYNEIFNIVTEDKPILVLTSNSSKSIVTNFIIFQSKNISEMLIEELKDNKYSRLIESNSIFVINSLRQSTSNLTTGEEKTKNIVRAIEPKSSISSLLSTDNTVIRIQAQLSNLSSFDINSFESINRNLERWNELKEAGLNPIMFVQLKRNYLDTSILINSGYSKNDLSKKFNITEPTSSYLLLTPIFKLSEQVKVPNFDKLVDLDAQSFLLKKVKGHVNRRVSGVNDINLYFTEVFSKFPNSSIDKNFFKPSSSTLNNLYVLPGSFTKFSSKTGYTSNTPQGIKIQLDRLDEVLKLSNPRIEMRLGDAIETSIKAYQEAWGSYKPLSRNFFTGNHEDLIAVRELFYPILYAYVNRALGGYISSSGKRKYKPKLSSDEEKFEKMLKQFTPLTEEENNLIRYMNRANKPYDNRVKKDYFNFIENFMQDKAENVDTSDDYAINFVSKNEESDFSAILRDSGFSIPVENSDFYVVSILGVETSGMKHVLRFLQSKYKIGRKVTDVEGESLLNLIYRNFYQFFIFIDTEKQEIKVIRPSLVDDATQFSINFQDWDIRMDLTNLINNLISKPKDLVVGDKDRVGLSKPAGPSEKSTAILRDEYLQRTGILDNELLLHYDPMKFNRVTRQRSGHLFFENTQGILVIFPFDTFYHDMEGQREQTIDVCFTSVPHIYDGKLTFLLKVNLAEEFSKWLEENKEVIMNYMDSNLDGQILPTISQISRRMGPIITPQVFYRIFRESIQERLEGHVFTQEGDASAACVYTNPVTYVSANKRIKQGFFSSGDLGMMFGGDTGGGAFPYHWQMGGDQSVSGLESRFSRRTKADFVSLFTGEVLELQILDIIGLKNVSDSEVVKYIMDVVEKYNNRSTANFNGSDYLVALYKYFTSNATVNTSSGEVERIVRNEIKEHLRKNPEALQVKKVSRRNMSIR